MACTIRLADDTAKFGHPRSTSDHSRLCRIAAAAAARGPRPRARCGATGNTISADEAWRIGLVNRVVPAAQLLDEARALAKTLAAKAPVAMRYILDAVISGDDMSFADAEDHEATLFGLVSTTDDMREGTRAFLEKRKATFHGK